MFKAISTYRRLLFLVAFFPFVPVFGQFNQIHLIGQATGAKLNMIPVDLNADGWPDLVVGSAEPDQGVGGGCVYYQLNAADGTGYLAPQVLSQGDGRAAVADFDQDGDPDVVCTRGLQTGLTWYRNDGQGSFEQAQTWATNHNFDRVEAADLDGDGDDDVIAISWLTSAQIQVFENLDGAGATFAVVHTVALSSNGINWMEVADIDSDTYPDILYKDFSTTSWIRNTSGANISWAPKQMLHNQVLTAAVPADLDNDGLVDLIINTQNGPKWKKRTAGGFAAGIEFTFGVSDQRTTLAVHDADQDGDADVVAGGATQVVFIRNNGAGTFGVEVVDDLGPTAELAFADVDNDGDSDLIAANSAPEKIAVFSNTNGNASFGPLVIVNAEYRTIADLALVDVDQDGDADVVTANENFSANNPAIKQLAWYENESGYFRRQHVISADWSDFYAVKPADFDQDGDLDLLAAGRNPAVLCWFENDGAGVFGPVHTLPLLFGASIILTPDLDNNGWPDILAAANSNGGSPLGWYKNTGGQFGQGVILSGLTYPQGLAVLNLDSDTFPDIAIAQESFNTLDMVGFLHADSAGHYSNNVTNFFNTSADGAIKTADLDGDGRPDVAAVGADAITVFLSSNGFAKQVAAGGPTFGFNGEDLAIADIDLDGDMDLVVTASPSGSLVRVRWYENVDGLGHFNSGFDITEVNGVYSVQQIACADMDLDGDQDIILEDFDRIVWLENEVGSSRTISGRCFWDINANGQLDPGEAALEQRPVHLSPLQRTTYTNLDGQFRFYMPPGQYELSFDPEFCQALTTPAVISANTLNASVGNLLFGLQYDPDSSGLRAWLLASPTVCDRQVHFNLVIENTGCQSESGTVTLHRSQLADFLYSSLAPDLNSADSLIWTFENLPPGNREEIGLIFKVADFNSIGDSVIMTVVPRTTTGGNTVTRNTFRFASVITCAYDPNDKQVWPARGGANPVYPGEELAYTIRFQNTGTDTAFTVFLQDRLAPELDWATLRPLAASHVFTSMLDENGLLTFRFDNIQLPDSGANWAASQGFVTFLIRLRAGLPLNTTIENKADIFFDFNPPVQTNVVSVWLPDMASVSESPIGPDHPISLYPNPFSERLYFRWKDRQEHEPFHLEWWDMTNRLVGSYPLPAGTDGVLQVPADGGTVFFYQIVRDRDGAVLDRGKLIRM